MALSVTGALAIVQLLYFLQVDLPAQKREDLHLILFTFLLLAIMAAGTIWVTVNLAVRMIG